MSRRRTGKTKHSALGRAIPSHLSRSPLAAASPSPATDFPHPVNPSALPVAVVSEALAETRALQLHVDALRDARARAPENFIPDLEVSLEWKRAVLILDEIEAALAQSSRALEVHMQVTATKQRFRQKLCEAGELLLESPAETRIGLPANIRQAISEAEQLRLSSSATRHLVLSLTASAAVDTGTDITQAVTDRLP